MRILMINSVCGIRSTGRICTDLATELEAQGHEIKIAYGRKTVPEQYQKYAVRIGTDFDIMLHGLKARLFDGMGFGSKKVTLDFIEWVKKFDPDVIHLHNIHGYYINVEVLFRYLKTCGKKIIWTLHDCWAFTGHCVNCNMDECEKWVKGCSNCPDLNVYPKSITDNAKVNWTKKRELFTGVNDMTIITPSEWLAKKVKSSYLSGYRVEVINNGIDTSVFKPIYSDVKSKYDIADKKLILGVTSVWSHRKGLDDFIELSKQLSDEYRIVMIGLTNKQIRALPNNIIGIQRTNNTKELAEWYSAADIFVNPTYEDNYPTTNLEAIACGTPVVTYKTGGSPESIDPTNGRIVEKGNVNKLAQAILRYNSYETTSNKDAVDAGRYDKSIATRDYIKLMIQ